MADLELERLLREDESGRLAPAVDRDPIAESVGLAIPSDVDTIPGAASIASPLTETGTTGTQVIISSDGLFALEYPQQTHYDDDNGQPVTIIHA